MGDLNLAAAPEPDRDLRADVERVVAVIRPAIQADGGDITLVDVDEGTGVVTVELLGACGLTYDRCEATSDEMCAASAACRVGTSWG